jgi:hypothetical protein
MKMNINITIFIYILFTSICLFVWFNNAFNDSITLSVNNILEK